MCLCASVSANKRTRSGGGFYYSPGQVRANKFCVRQSGVKESLPFQLRLGCHRCRLAGDGSVSWPLSAVLQAPNTSQHEGQRILKCSIRHPKTLLPSADLSLFGRHQLSAPCSGAGGLPDRGVLVWTRLRIMLADCLPPDLIWRASPRDDVDCGAATRFVMSQCIPGGAAAAAD